jgi:limonene-1,2-epoxide hydrolase
MAAPSSVVEGFFMAMGARRWDEAAQFLADDVRVWWPVTNERFNGPRFMAMQEAYPEGWTITVVEVTESQSRVAARIAVDQAGERFWCHGWYDVDEDRIIEAVELWGTEASEAPPPWRARYTD